MNNGKTALGFGKKEPISDLQGEVLVDQRIEADCGIENGGNSH